MKRNLLSIRLSGEQVGILEQNSAGKKIFTYDATATRSISIAMPIRKESYQDLQCEAYFGGLLPESEIVKKIIAKKYGVSANNSFSLLKAIGHDCAGAISCHTIDEPIVSNYAVPLSGEIISNEKLYQHIVDLPRNPLFLDVKGLRLSLAGVQEKAAVCLIDNQIAFPEQNCPTTHILKPGMHTFEGITENEYFILKIAKRIGLPVPNIELRKVKDITYLLIERYDRHIKDNFVERIHQEDFCQALGVLSSKKYQNEGGPNLENCFQLLNLTTQPAVDRNLLMTGVIFNYLVGNMDAHGKNFSLLHHNTSNLRLAPFYDMVCTRAYENLTAKMAMKIDSKYSADDVLPRHWQRLCEQINYRYIALRNLLEELGNKIKIAMHDEATEIKERGVNDIIITKVKRIIDRNIDKTLAKFENL